MSISELKTLGLTAAVLTLGTLAEAATYTFTETDFLPGSMIAEAAVGPVGGQATAVSGGTYGVTTTTNSTTYTGHFLSGASLTPLGESIVSVDFQIDYNVQNRQHAFGLIIEQGGSYFINYQLTGFTGGWKTLDVDGLLSANIPGIGAGGVANGTFADFTDGADTLRFGFFTANSLSSGASVIYDNIEIIVTTAPSAVPLPAGGALLLLGLGGLGLGVRRRGV
ncbi:hypothetical protein [Tropicibacter sp. S64]|uniref:hypothetical protein n=1 Tax=Tropicibacter sp. S64 TaxID=3415122 RepID=UPI003C7A1EB6